MKPAIGMLIIFLCTSCAAGRSAPEMETVPAVDLTRYQGSWYEIARLPAWFQRGCTQSKATYSLLESGKMAVTNECVTAKGTHKVAHGTAHVIDTRTNAKLEVIFDNWVSRLFPSLTKGDYWILYLDPEYRTVIVGTPDKKYLWILARARTLDEETYQELVGRCRELGFDTDRLMKAHH
jgi:apolipoprotein D and lipocalin family protein